MRAKSDLRREQSAILLNSNAVFSSGIGDDITFFKLGSRMGLRRSDTPIVLLSMGVGVMTMRPLIRAYKNDKSSIPSLISLNIDSAGDFVYRKELGPAHG